MTTIPAFQQLLAATESDAHLLEFEHSSQYNGGSRWPYDHVITATHPERGSVGYVQYKTSSDRANAKIKIDRLEVHKEERRRGYGSALMDQLQRQHPKSSIDHGDRTDLGKAWWSGYGEGNSDRRGRTIARNARPQTYFHGTHAEGLTHIVPAARHDLGTLYEETDPHYAYATVHPSDAWDYAADASADIGKKPRVYEVRPMHGDHTHVEDDPDWDDVRNIKRDTNPGDRRSKVGWEVVRELPTASHFYEPMYDHFDWPGKDEEKRQRASGQQRTAAADWQFSHHHIEGPHWRSFGGPAGAPRQVMLQYKLRDGGIQFESGSDHEYQVRKHGPEAVGRVQQAVREHHGVGDAPPEAPPPPARPKPRIYFHGTTAEDVTHILPASHHGGGVMFSSETDPSYAYASKNAKDAWHYAEMAHYVTGGKPRVYQVRPLHGDHSHVEKDPQWDDQRGHSRGNFEGDRRSKKGWEVVRELKTPRHIHENFDWPGKEDDR